MSDNPDSMQSSAAEAKKQGFSWSAFKESAKVNLESGRGIFDGVIEKFKDLPETNYQVGRQMVMRGALKDALLRFRIGLWFDETHAELNYAIACCYIETGEKDKAAKHFVRALQTNPAYEEARFQLAGIRPDLIPEDQHPRRMPMNMLVDYFEVLSLHYDERQKAAQYNGPAIVEHYLNAELDARRVDLHLLELGCGSGLLGARLRSKMKHSVGVDVCRPMLEVAANKQKLHARPDYDELVNDEATSHLTKETAETVDVLAALNMLQYSGDLSAFFAGAKKVLKEDGIFIFTFYPNTRTSDFGQVPGKGYFGHNPDYIKGLASRNGLQVRHISDAAIYPQTMHNIAVLRNAA